MDEVRSYLFSGEKVQVVVRPHPVVLVKPALAPLAGIALFAGFPGRFTGVVLLVVLAKFAWDAAMWWLDRFILTTDRILSLSGIITKKVVTLPLAKMTDLAYSRSLLGRLLGYGSLDFESAGEQDFGRIDFLPDPDEFYRSVMSLALGPRPDGEPPSDPGHVYEPETREMPIIRTSDD